MNNINININNIINNIKSNINRATEYSFCLVWMFVPSPLAWSCVDLLMEGGEMELLRVEKWNY